MLHIAFPLMVSTSTEAMLMFIDRLYLKQVSAEAMNACLSGGFTSFAWSSKLPKCAPEGSKEGSKWPLPVAGTGEITQTGPEMCLCALATCEAKKCQLP